jgi:hypothetical protein
VIRSRRRQIKVRRRGGEEEGNLHIIRRQIIGIFWRLGFGSWRPVETIAVKI